MYEPSDGSLIFLEPDFLGDPEMTASLLYGGMRGLWLASPGARLTVMLEIEVKSWVTNDDEFWWGPSESEPDWSPLSFVPFMGEFTLGSYYQMMECPSSVMTHTRYDVDEDEYITSHVTSHNKLRWRIIWRAETEENCWNYVHFRLAQYVAEYLEGEDPGEGDPSGGVFEEIWHEPDYDWGSVEAGVRDTWPGTDWFELTVSPPIAPPPFVEETGEATAYAWRRVGRLWPHVTFQRHKNGQYLGLIPGGALEARLNFPERFAVDYPAE